MPWLLCYSPVPSQQGFHLPAGARNCFNWSWEITPLWVCVTNTVLSSLQRVSSAQSLGCGKLGILKPRKSKTTRVCSLLAAQSGCDMMPTHQLGRSIQGVKLPNNRKGLVGPLLAVVENAISFVEPPFSVFALPHWCQDLNPKNLPKKLEKCFPLLAVSLGRVLQTGWGSPAGWQG